MGKQSPVKKIEMELKSLSLADQRRVVTRISQHLRRKRGEKRPLRDWSKLYGLGKGLWRRQDAQKFVNRLREDRV